MTTHLHGQASKSAQEYDANLGRAAYREDIVIPGTARTPASPTGVLPAPTRAGGRWLAVLRIAVGGIFLWPFLDKMFGLGYSTGAGRSVIEGNSPTNGFLSNLDAGPGQGFFHAIAGTWFADVLFMAALGAIGVAVILGVGLRISAVAGTVLMMMMWFAEWPLARYADSGDPTGSTNPLLDYHVIYALALIAVAVTAAGSVWGLGRMWASLPFVQRHAWLK
jgi:thiosulfate dehydrogenase [quinone] large subunit